MTNDEFKERVKTYTWKEWIKEILDDPSVLTDPYYKECGRALVARGHELLESKP